MTTATMTQEQMVLDYLNRFGKITKLKAMTDLQIGRLSEYIRRLRKKGYNIVTDMKETYGGRKYAEYRLSHEVKQEPSKDFEVGGMARFEGYGDATNRLFDVCPGKWTEGDSYEIIEIITTNEGIHCLNIHDDDSGTNNWTMYEESRFFTPV